MVAVCAEDLPACTPFETSTNTKAKENINAKKKTAAPVRVEWLYLIKKNYFNLGKIHIAKTVPKIDFGI